MQAVAEAAGVSQQAVSQAINNTGRLGPETRERVLAVARSLGYRINTSAKAMRSGRFDCIALMLSVHAGTSTLPPTVLSGIQTGADRFDLSLKLGRLPDQKLTAEGYVPKLLREWSVDGVLFNYTDHIPKKLMELVRKYTIPSLWINAKLPSDCVFHDDYAAGRLATEHLLGLGHQRIAYVDFVHPLGQLEESHYSARDRWAGYCDAVRAAGLTPHTIWQDDKRLSADRAKGVEAMLSSPDRPTAIVTYSSVIARTICFAAAYAGLRVPGDLSVVTIDERSDYSYNIKTSTAVLGVYQLGEVAVEQLQRKFDEPDVRLESVPIAPVFEPGGSSAPPSGGG